MNKQTQIQQKSEPDQIRAKAINKTDGEETAVSPPIQPILQRAYADPGNITPNDTRILQRTIGNQALRRLVIQRKMTVGPVGDKYEQEADAVAKQVVGKINTPQQDVAQRQEEDEDIQMMPISTVQRQEEEELQLKPSSTMAGGDVSEDIEGQIQSAKGGGRPLSANTQSSMEQAFNADFSSVKVHTGNQPNMLNRSISARAFTSGQDIFFRSGEYNPDSSAGKELLAHELTHTVQQGAAPQASANVTQRTASSNIQRMGGWGSRKGKEPAEEMNWVETGLAPGVDQEKDQFAQHLMKIVKYTDSVEEMIGVLQSKESSAANFNKALAGFSAVQLACGVAATALGVTLIVLTAGAAAPVVLGGVAAAATGTSISGGVVGAAGGVSKAGRQNAMGSKNEGFEHLMAPDSKAKASGVETVKAGAAQGVAAGTKETGEVIGTAVGESATNATAETVGTAATTAAFATAGGVAAVGGVINTGFAAKGLHDAYTFDSKSLYNGTSEGWVTIAANLKNFRISLGRKQYTDLQPQFCEVLREKLAVTEDKVRKLREASS